MPTLDRAVALAQVDHVAVGIREHLDLDVARILEIALDVHRRVGEVRLALSSRRFECALGLGRPGHDLQALAAAAGRGLDRERPAELLAEPDDLGRGGHRFGRPGHDRNAGCAHLFPRRGLRAHRLDRVAWRPDPDQPGSRDGPSERGVLGEKAVAGVDRLGAGAGGGVEDPLLVEVTPGGGTGPDQVSLVGRRNVQRGPVDLGVDGHGADPELAQRPKDADGNLAAVRYEDFRERSHRPYSPRT